MAIHLHGRGVQIDASESPMTHRETSQQQTRRPTQYPPEKLPSPRTSQQDPSPPAHPGTSQTWNFPAGITVTHYSPGNFSAKPVALVSNTGQQKVDTMPWGCTTNT